MERQFFLRCFGSLNCSFISITTRTNINGKDYLKRKNSTRQRIDCLFIIKTWTKSLHFVLEGGRVGVVGDIAGYAVGGWAQ